MGSFILGVTNLTPFILPHSRDRLSPGRRGENICTAGCISAEPGGEVGGDLGGEEPVFLCNFYEDVRVFSALEMTALRVSILYGLGNTAEKPKL